MKCRANHPAGMAPWGMHGCAEVAELEHQASTLREAMIEAQNERDEAKRGPCNACLTRAITEGIAETRLAEVKKILSSQAPERRMVIVEMALRAAEGK